MAKTQAPIDDVSKWEIPDISDGINRRGLAPPSAKQLERIQQEAYEEGLAKGYNEGMQKADKELERLKSCMRDLLKTMADPLHHIDHAVEHEIVELVVALCAKLTQREYEKDPTLLFDIIKKAKAQIFMPGLEVYLYMNPEDLAMMNEVVEEGDFTNIHVVEQPKLQRGDIHFKTETTDVDASMAARLHNLLEHHFAERL